LIPALKGWAKFTPTLRLEINAQLLGQGRPLHQNEASQSGFAIFLNVFTFLRLVLASLHVVLASLDIILASLHAVLAPLHVVLSSPHAVLASLHVVLAPLHAVLPSPRTVLASLRAVLRSLHVVSRPCGLFCPLLRSEEEKFPGRFVEFRPAVRLYG
jgi:hypothetical protein